MDLKKEKQKIVNSYKTTIIIGFTGFPILMGIACFEP
jgi:hypothetical protein